MPRTLHVRHTPSSCSQLPAATTTATTATTDTIATAATISATATTATTAVISSSSTSSTSSSSSSRPRPRLCDHDYYLYDDDCSAPASCLLPPASCSCSCYCYCHGCSCFQHHRHPLLLLAHRSAVGRSRIHSSSHKARSTPGRLPPTRRHEEEDRSSRQSLNRDLATSAPPSPYEHVMSGYSLLLSLAM